MIDHVTWLWSSLRLPHIPAKLKKYVYITVLNGLFLDYSTVRIKTKLNFSIHLNLLQTKIMHKAIFESTCIRGHSIFVLSFALCLDPDLEVRTNTALNLSSTAGLHVSIPKYRGQSKVSGCCKSNLQSSLCRSRTFPLGPQLWFKVLSLASSPYKRWLMCPVVSRTVTLITVHSYFLIALDGIVRSLQSWTRSCALAYCRCGGTGDGVVQFIIFKDIPFVRVFLLPFQRNSSFVGTPMSTFVRAPSTMWGTV